VKKKRKEGRKEERKKERRKEILSCPKGKPCDLCLANWAPVIEK
jgi:hypothetical protein